MQRRGHNTISSDVATVVIMIETSRNTTVSAETAFPFKLHVVLDQSEKLGFDNVISWQGNNAFMVHKPKKFEDSIMKEYFNQTLYKSFQKQRKFLITFGNVINHRSVFQILPFFLAHRICFTTPLIPQLHGVTTN